VDQEVFVLFKLMICGRFQQQEPYFYQRCYCCQKKVVDFRFSALPAAVKREQIKGLSSNFYSCLSDESLEQLLLVQFIEMPNLRSFPY
jgi:hypothetical protein